MKNTMVASQVEKDSDHSTCSRWRFGLSARIKKRERTRDRLTGVMRGNSFFVLAGFDGNQWVNDFFEISFDTMEW